MDMIATVAYSASILPYFLRYYADLGYDRFLIGVHDTPESEVGRKVLAEVPDSAVVSFLGAGRFVYDNDIAFIRAATAFSAAQRGVWDTWVGIADIDEFHEYPSIALGLKDSDGARMMTAPEMVAACKAEGKNCVKGRIIDRVAADGSLPEIDAGGASDLPGMFPQLLPFTEQIISPETRKIMIYQAALYPSGGHHYADGENPLRNDLQVHHYKWHSEVLGHYEKLRDSLRADGKTWNRNYTCFRRHWRQYGKICLDPL